MCRNKHTQKLRGYLLCATGLVDQRTNNKNIEVAVISIYTSMVYLQQNDELMLNLQETIQTIYDD